MNAKLDLNEVYNITGIGSVAVGVVSSGVLSVGLSTIIDGKESKIKFIEANKKQISEAQIGTNVGITLSNANYKKLKALSGTTLNFSGSVQTLSESSNSEVTKPIGLFGTINKIFNKN